MKSKFIDMYMSISEIVSKLSHAKRLQVGSVIVKDDRIISMGYNGMPSGWDNNCEEKVYKIDGWLVDDVGSYELKTRPEVLHAESNAIAKLARSNDSGEGSTLFVTHSPCIECSKLIYQSGIKSVWYKTLYRDSSGIEFLKKSGIVVNQFKKEEE